MPSTMMSRGMQGRRLLSTEVSWHDAWSLWAKLVWCPLIWRSVGAEVHLVANTNHGPANQPWLSQHQINELIITQVLHRQPQLLEARASKTEHFASGSASQQIPDLIPGEGLLEEVALVDLYLFVRKKLFRLTTDRSPCPAVEIHLHSHRLTFLLNRNTAIVVLVPYILYSGRFCPSIP